MRPYGLPAVAAGAALALLLAGCTDQEPAARPEEPEPAVVLYGTDGTMQDAFAELFPDRTVLRGMKGTAPLERLPAAFTNRLLEIDPGLTDFQYAGQTYDAIVISALAAELAGTPDPEVVRDYVNGVTTGGQECEAVADCLELARAGEPLAYRGVSLSRGGFTDLGEPAAASYAIQHFGADGKLDPDQTEFVGAGDPAETTDAEPPEPGPRPTEPTFAREPLRFGGLLPETGGLSFAYPPMTAGAQLAIEEINDADGVLGVDVEWQERDTGTDGEVAADALAAHIEDEVHILIGAAASSVTEAIMADAVAARRILFSPSNTAANLSAADHDGFYFRTAPSDVLQGAALADIILRDGVARIAIVARDDAYGRGLQSDVQDALREFGVPAAEIRLLTYRPPEAEGDPVPGLAGVVEEIIAGQPEGVLVIGYDEVAQVIQELVTQGVRIRP